MRVLSEADYYRLAAEHIDQTTNVVQQAYKTSAEQDREISAEILDSLDFLAACQGVNEDEVLPISFSSSHSRHRVLATLQVMLFDVSGSAKETEVNDILEQTKQVCHRTITFHAN